MKTAMTAAAGTPARQAMPDRLCCSAVSEVSAARDTFAPRRLSVDRSVTVSAVAPDAPADSVAVAVAAVDGVTGNEARGSDGVVVTEAGVAPPAPLEEDAAAEDDGGTDGRLAEAEAEPMVA